MGSPSKPKSKLNIIKVSSQRGFAIIYNNYKYLKKKTSKTGDIIWKCASKGRVCPISITTNAQLTQILRDNEDHNHDPLSKDQLKDEELKYQVKKKALEDTSVKPLSIIKSVSLTDKSKKETRRLRKLIYRKRLSANKYIDNEVNIEKEIMIKYENASPVPTVKAESPRKRKHPTTKVDKPVAKIVKCEENSIEETPTNVRTSPKRMSLRKKTPSMKYQNVIEEQDDNVLVIENTTKLESPPKPTVPIPTQNPINAIQQVQIRQSKIMEDIIHEDHTISAASIFGLSVADKMRRLAVNKRTYLLTEQKINNILAEALLELE